jgi:hypothetical protein
MQAIPGCTSEAKWLRHARAHLRHLFPCLPQQPGCSKQLRKAAGLMRSVNPILATTTSVWSDDVWAVDSTPVECGRSRETLLDLLAAECELLRERPRQTLTGDKNYFGRGFERELPEHGVQLRLPRSCGQ